MSAIITTKSLSIGYSKDKPLLKDISLTLDIGKLTIIIGDNGCGKSTLLKTFTKIIKPIDGAIYLQQRNINTIPTKEFAKLVAVVLTDRLESENFTAEEVIAFGRSPYTNFFGKLNNNDYQIIKSVAEELSIDKILSRNFYQLSDGQKQKVLIAKALVQQAKIIILDEPTAFLDFKTKDSIFALLKKISIEKQIAIVISTHDIYQAAKYGDEFWIIDNKLLRIETDASSVINGLLL